MNINERIESLNKEIQKDIENGVDFVETHDKICKLRKLEEYKNDSFFRISANYLLTRDYLG